MFAAHALESPGGMSRVAADEQAGASKRDIMKTLLKIIHIVEMTGQKMLKFKGSTRRTCPGATGAATDWTIRMKAPETTP